jgi:uncharacterized NAD(P)/FAD-binding protein YdhS
MSLTDEAEMPVAIVGAGFSGTLLAINLVRQGARVVLIERDGGRLAKGLAFGTRQVEHLLNVRASNMSAYPDDPEHFQRWVGERSGARANRFVPRGLWPLSARAIDGGPVGRAGPVHDLHRRGAEAVVAPDGVEIRLDTGEVIEARALVLALGNLAPTPPPVLAGLSGDVLRADPWGPAAIEDLAPDAHVLLVGTGLTAVDVAISLDQSGFKGQITALSRRGLIPHAHAAEGPHVRPVSRPEERGSWLLRHVRRRVGEVGWRHAVDELRPHTQSLWRLHDKAGQARFLRHLRAWWDVHRHRLAPAVAEHVARLTQGRMTVAAGRIVTAHEENGHVEIAWRGRGEDALRTLTADRIILCTGPEGDITRCDNVLLHALVGQGLARPDAHRLGLDVDHGARLIGRDGRAHDALFAVGP